MKKITMFVFLLGATITVNSCGVKDSIDESLDALECANRLEDLEDNNSSDCENTLRVLNEIESSCGEFLSDASKENIAQLRAVCNNN